MRDPARIPRMIELLEKLSSLDIELDFGPLLEKWVFADAIARMGDIFYPDDDGNEKRLQQAVDQLLSTNHARELSDDRVLILKTVRNVWEQVPDQRLGQLLSNYFFGHFLSHPPGGMLHQTDKQLVENLPKLS